MTENRKEIPMREKPCYCPHAISLTICLNFLKPVKRLDCMKCIEDYSFIKQEAKDA